ncbi:MAG: discoidin domain-containing protein [Candidatus Aminicenantales bacterium]
MIRKAIISAIAFLFMTIIGLSALAPSQSQDSSKEELKLQLPKPMFIGTPRNIKTSNLEVITGKPRGPFFVAKGTKILSLKKPVISSDMQPVIGELNFITDGEKSGEDGYFVELGPEKQWIQIDLQGEFNLNAVVVWHYHAQARVYRDVVVQVSDDKDCVNGVTTLFNNDHDNTTGLGIGKDKEYIETNEGKLIDPKGLKARYLRLFSNGNTSNDMNHYVEVEVYGTPAK